MNDRLTIEHPGPQSLVVSKNKAGGLETVAGYLIFYMFWYGIHFAGPLQELGRTGDPFMHLLSLEGWLAFWRSATPDGSLDWIFLGVPLLALPNLLRPLKIVLFGEVILFDGSARIISRDGKQGTLYADTRGVEIKIIADSESPDHYRVSVLRNSGPSLFVAESDNYEPMANVAGDIARVLNTEIVKA